MEHHMVDPDHTSGDQCRHDVGYELDVDVVMEIVVNLASPEQPAFDGITSTEHGEVITGLGRLRFLGR